MPTSGITPRDLLDDPSHGPGRILLLCRKCGSEYSAQRGDYFTSSPDKPIKCCKQNLALVRKRVVYEDVG